MSPKEDSFRFSPFRRTSYIWMIRLCLGFPVEFGLRPEPDPFLLPPDIVITLISVWLISDTCHWLAVKFFTCFCLHFFFRTFGKVALGSRNLLMGTSNFACNLDWFYYIFAVEYYEFWLEFKVEKNLNWLAFRKWWRIHSYLHYHYYHFKISITKYSTPLHYILLLWLKRFFFQISMRWYQTAEKMWYSGPYFLGSPLFASKYKEEIDLI